MNTDRCRWSPEEKITTLFPEDSVEHKQPNIVILEKAVGRGKRRNKYDSVVILSFEDFKQFIKK